MRGMNHDREVFVMLHFENVNRRTTHAAYATALTHDEGNAGKADREHDQRRQVIRLARPLEQAAACKVITCGGPFAFLNSCTAC